MDLMKINKGTTLHVVYKDAKFRTASFIKKESSENIWKAFLYFWVALYVGYPDVFILDQGSQFQATEISELFIAAGIEKSAAGEGCEALREVEQLHAYHQNVFERVQSEHASVAAEALFALSVEACRDTAGPSGMDPTLLVVGVVPKISKNSDSPKRVAKLMLKNELITHSSTVHESSNRQDQTIHRC